MRRTKIESQPPPTETEAIEIEALMEHFRGEENLAELYRLVDGQLAIVHARAQSLTQLAGVVITVTGFSGRIIADTNTLAQALIITGLALVLLAAAVCMIFVMPVRWLSSYLDFPREVWLLTAIRRRNKKSKAYYVAIMILMVGMLLYITSISIMLGNPELTELELVR